MHHDEPEQGQTVDAVLWYFIILTLDILNLFKKI